MFARFARLPLKRALHTASGSAAQSAPRFSRNAKFIVGSSAAAAAAAYLSYNMSTEKNRLHLDAAAPSKVPASSKPAPSTSSRPEPSTPPTPPASEFVPDAPESEDENKPSAEGEPEAEGEGEGKPHQGGAYNPETGEINWDCPCLGGMAHGPCGEQFKEAFSCFVFSEDEPKGINCVEHFKRMQDCFREHPEIYADEIMRDDDDDEPAAAPAPESTPTSTSEAVAEVPALADSRTAPAASTTPSSTSQ